MIMNLSTQTDTEVFQALKAGDISALGVLYDRYGGVVYRLALKILTDPQAAEDLTQEVFLLLWRKGSYDPKRGSLNSFLMTLTHSRAIDRIRSQGAKQRSIERWGQNLEVGPTVSTPLELASTEERAQRVQEAMKTLPESQRRVLEMAYYAGMSQSEIAQKLNTPLGTIKTQARQGLIKLKRLLKDFVG
jgi:RNA polymerase sigma-70 factor, ECF subfamily